MEIMANRKIDALWLFPSANMYYLTGFWPSAQDRQMLSILSRTGESIFVVPEMYERQISKYTWIKDIRAWKNKEDFEITLNNVVKELHLSKGKIALEDRTWAKFFIKIQNSFSRIKFCPASSILKESRIFKSDLEVKFLMKAGNLAKEIMNDIIEELEVGISELEISGLIEYFARKKGSQKMSFETIVSFGKNSSNPHSEPSKRRLRKRDVIMIDLGPKYKGYCSDMTRTIFIGEVPKKVRKVYEIVAKAQNRALLATKPNIKACELDEVARKVMREYGFEEFFIHGTGHGIGLDIHEAPYITKENDSKIKKGMVFTIEPGIYLTEKFGVRIEDSVLVTDDGYDILTNYPKDFYIL